MISNNTKSNSNAHHGADNHTQAGKRGLLFSFMIFMAWVGVIGLLLSLIACQPMTPKTFASIDNSGYHIVLSKLNSGQASRDTLAFFVPDNSEASQAVTIYSSTAPKTYLSVIRGYSLISMAAPQSLPTSYDGLTLQNKIAARQICRAVSVKTESKTRHPISLLYSVAFTQNLTGAIHHG